MDLAARFWRGGDQHVLEITLIVMLLAVMVPVSWLAHLVALVPQGRIFAKVGDYRKSKQPIGNYLWVNEVIVVLAVLLTLLLQK